MSACAHTTKSPVDAAPRIESRTFVSGFESLADFAGMYISPQTATTRHALVSTPRHGGEHAHCAWLTGRGTGADTDGPNHRGYPTVQVRKIDPRGFATPAVIDLWGRVSFDRDPSPLQLRLGQCGRSRAHSARRVAAGSSRYGRLVRRRTPPEHRDPSRVPATAMGTSFDPHRLRPTTRVDRGVAKQRARSQGRGERRARAPRAGALRDVRNRVVDVRHGVQRRPEDNESLGVGRVFGPLNHSIVRPVSKARQQLRGRYA